MGDGGFETGRRLEDRGREKETGTGVHGSAPEILLATCKLVYWTFLLEFGSITLEAGVSRGIVKRKDEISPGTTNAVRDHYRTSTGRVQNSFTLTEGAPKTAYTSVHA